MYLKISEYLKKNVSSPILKILMKKRSYVQIILYDIILSIIKKMNILKKIQLFKALQIYERRKE